MDEQQICAQQLCRIIGNVNNDESILKDLKYYAYIEENIRECSRTIVNVGVKDLRN